MIRALVTGAAGPIGSRTHKKLIEQMDLEDSNVEFILCIDTPDTPPMFSNTNKRKWETATLDTVDANWWLEKIEEYSINTIYYLESTENENEFLPNDILNNQLRESDTTFISSLHDLYIDPDFTKLKVVYISTDKIYQEDKFPNELNDILIIQPEGNDVEPNPVLNYVALKLNSELELTSMSNLDLRIIRPFSMVAPEQNASWPLSNLVLQSISDAKIPVYGDGLRGLAFIHVDDIVDYILHPNLFTTEMLSRIINVARVRNYLSEELLVRKVILKTNSSASMDLQSSEDNFQNLMNIPQIRNSILVYEPRIPIEKIIEDIHFAMNPVNHYIELVVTDVEYILDNYLVVKGLAEPEANIVLQIGDGSTMSTVVTDDGSWSVTSTDPINFTDDMTGIAYATVIPLGVQYDTYLFDIPAASIH